MELINGWKPIETAPLFGQRVLVTNNPATLDSTGQMFNIWIARVYVIFDKKGREYFGYTEGGLRIQNLCAWHSLPKNAIGAANSQAKQREGVGDGH